MKKEYYKKLNKLLIKQIQTLNLLQSITKL